MGSDNIDSVERFYGNGTVYVAGTERVRTFEEYNFDVESLRTEAYGDYWVTSEVVVALGSEVTRKKALRALRRVVARIEREIEKGRRYR